MVCKKCGAPLLEDDQFCPECGAKVIRKKKCPECGETLREGTRFCPSCGAAVGEGRPVKRAESEETTRNRADSEEAPRRRADAEEAPRRRDWEEEDWDDEDDDEESVDILSIMTVAVGCILLVIVAVLGFNLFQRYVPKDYDRAAEEQEIDEEEADGEEQEEGQKLEEPPEDSEEEPVITTAKKGDTYEYTEVVEGGHWYKVILPDGFDYEYGYISAKYVEEQ